MLTKLTKNGEKPKISDEIITWGGGGVPKFRTENAIIDSGVFFFSDYSLSKL